MGGTAGLPRDSDKYENTNVLEKFAKIALFVAQLRVIRKLCIKFERNQPNGYRDLACTNVFKCENPNCREKFANYAIIKIYFAAHFWVIRKLCITN